MTRSARRRALAAAGGAAILALGTRGLALGQEGGDAPPVEPAEPVEPAPPEDGGQPPPEAPPTGPQAAFDLLDGPVVVSLELARTDAERTKGLGGHAPLEDGDGMLFVFDLPARHAFWMKGMTFPLDIMWIEDGVVVHLERDLPPSGPQETDANRPIYSPFVPARYVLEVNAGFAAEHGIVPGTAVAFSDV